MYKIKEIVKIKETVKNIIFNFIAKLIFNKRWVRVIPYITS